MGMLDSLKNLVGVDDEQEPEEQATNNRNIRVLGKESKVLISKVVMFEDATNIAQQFLQGTSMVLNFESTEKEVVRRVLDFLSGVAYAVEGTVNKVAQHTYIMTPSCVEVTNDGFFDV